MSKQISDDHPDASVTPICDQLRATSNWNAEWDAFTQLDPVWTEKFMSMAVHPMSKDLIEPKVWEFISIAVDASCTHMYGPGTRRHIRRALELGASKQEIAAVLQYVSVLGVHSNSMGGAMLVEEVARLEGLEPAQILEANAKPGSDPVRPQGGS